MYVQHMLLIVLSIKTALWLCVVWSDKLDGSGQKLVLNHMSRKLLASEALDIRSVALHVIIFDVGNHCKGESNYRNRSK